MRLLVRMARHESGRIVAWVPALPGCRAFGDTTDMARACLERAVEGYLASLDVPVPQPLGCCLEIEAASFGN